MLPSIMRWFASLVVFCLLAGTGVRPRAEIREPHAAQQLAAADGLVPLVSSRRGGAVAPEGRLPLFIITPVAPAIVPPRQTVLPASRGPIAGRIAGSPRIDSARGPPGGRLSVDLTRS
ncbi:hypothetical protein BH11MYX3_BH11MYX3_31290 [soil metagenome]